MSNFRFAKLLTVPYWNGLTPKFYRAGKSFGAFTEAGIVAPVGTSQISTLRLPAAASLAEMLLPGASRTEDSHCFEFFGAVCSLPTQSTLMFCTSIVFLGERPPLASNRPTAYARLRSRFAVLGSPGSV